MNPYELKVLRELAEPGTQDITPGAAFNSCVEYLKGSGYVSAGLHNKVTKKGYAHLLLKHGQER